MAAPSHLGDPHGDSVGNWSTTCPLPTPSETPSQFRSSTTDTPLDQIQGMVGTLRAAGSGVLAHTVFGAVFNGLTCWCHRLLMADMPGSAGAVGCSVSRRPPPGVSTWCRQGRRYMIGNITSRDRRGGVVIASPSRGAVPVPLAFVVAICDLNPDDRGDLGDHRRPRCHVSNGLWPPPWSQLLRSYQQLGTTFAHGCETTVERARRRPHRRHVRHILGLVGALLAIPIAAP